MANQEWTNMLAFFGLPGWAEILIVAFVGLLLFGRRLPEVARSLGTSIVEFKKGMRDVKDEIDTASSNDRRIENPSASPLPRSASPNDAAKSEEPAKTSADSGD